MAGKKTNAEWAAQLDVANDKLQKLKEETVKQQHEYIMQLLIIVAGLTTKKVE